MSGACVLIAEENQGLAKFAVSIFDELGLPTEVCVSVDKLIEASQKFSNFLLSVDLSDGEGMPASKELWARNPSARILYWAERVAETCVRQALEFVPDDTVFGYITKHISSQGLKSAASQVFVEDQCFLQLEVSNVLKRLQDPKLGLTPHEYEVLVDIAVGLTDKAIAERRYLSRRGVTNRLNSVYRKLDLVQEESVKWGQTYNLRTRAVRLALKRGVLTEDLIDLEEKAWHKQRESEGI